MEKLKEKLKTIAAEELPDDDPNFDPSDMYCGNEDDAREQGERWGRIAFARSLLTEFFKD